MDQLVQVFGSLLILVAFAAAQWGTLSTNSRSYLVCSTILTILSGLSLRDAIEDVATDNRGLSG
jgi:uncharacterized membrane protein YjjP (DUF1212 family)